MHYIIYKYKGMYRILDILYEEMENGFSSNRHIEFKKCGNKLYEIHSIEVVDDYFLDIGKIAHWQEEKFYCGTIIYESNNIEEIALKYAELKEKEK